MSHLFLKLFGSYKLTLDGRPIMDSLESDKVRALLVYLAIEKDRAHPREKLIGIFWPEQNEEHARGSLSQALYHLRGVLGDRPLTGALSTEANTLPREQCLLVSSHEIQFNPKCVFETDVAVFSALVSGCKAHHHSVYEICGDCLKRYQEAASMYSGDFLDGFYLPKSLAFEEWATILREQLRLEAMEVFEHLVMAFKQQGELDQALVYARRMVELDELGEAGNSHVMRLLALLGRRGAALAQYASFRQALAIQLGAEPGMETKLLYQQLRNEDAGADLGNYPASLTPIIGRKEELKEIWGWLREPERRLICILGPGGCGKTRLALEAARRQRYHFRDGVYFVPLSGLGEGSSLQAAIAERLGFTFRDFGDHKNQLLDYLRNKKILLVLDSFETVIDNAGLVADLLSASEGSKALVTSRVRLNLSGEHIYPLMGMRVPPTDTIEQVVNNSSVELFLDSARRVKPGYQPKDLDGIAQICRLVEGVPLSVLLASSWVNDYSIQEILEEITRSLDFLSVEWADLPKRQQSLRATFEYSWDLLNSCEQEALMDLAVFRNPFSTKAAKQVAGASPQVLHALVSKSLLGVPAEGLFQMHDVVHQYSAEKLTLSPSEHEKTVHQKHSDYFLEQAAGWGKVLKGPKQAVQLVQVDTEVEDVKTAWEWAAQVADREQLWRASEGLFLYYFLSYRFQEGEQACQVAMKGLQNAPDGGERLNLEGWLLAWQAHFKRLLGKGELAKQLLDESMEKLEQAKAVGQDVRLGQALLWRERGYLADNLHDQIDCFRHSADLFEALGDAWWQAMVLAWAGEILNRMGNRALGLELHQQAVALSRTAGEPHVLARTMMNLAYDYLVCGPWETGSKLMEEAVGWFRSVGDPRSQATGELHLGISYGWTGRLREAYTLLEQALAKMHHLGDHFYIAYGTLGLGVIQMYFGRYGQAAQTLQEALQAAQQDGYLREVASGLSQIGCLALVQGKPQKGLQELQQSVASLRQMGFAGELGMALGGLALAQHLFGQEQQAWASLEEALHIAVETHSRFTLFNLGATIVVILADSGKWELTVEAYSALMTDPIVSSSRWTADMIGDRIDLAREKLPEDVRLAAEQHGQEGDLFEVLARISQRIDEWEMTSGK
jgi:predicted ATPase/DNA-binding SARP family transcriptional activator